MIFDVNVATHLVVWMVFVFWQFYRMTNKDRRFYEKHAERMTQYAIAPESFSLIWLMLYSLQVAFIFIFMQWTIDVAQYTFLTVYILFIVNTLLGKTWSMVFFGMRDESDETTMKANEQLAMVISFLMWASSVTILVLVGITKNIGANGVTTDNFNWMLFGFYAPYVLWLTFVMLYTNAFLRARYGKSRRSWSCFRFPRFMVSISMGSKIGQDVENGVAAVPVQSALGRIADPRVRHGALKMK